MVEHAGLLNRLIDPLVERVKSVAGLVATTVATAIGINIMASDQYIAIALPGRLFAPAFSKRGLEPAMLSRVVGDFATVTSPLIPWNSCRRLYGRRSRRSDCALRRILLFQHREPSTHHSALRYRLESVREPRLQQMKRSRPPRANVRRGRKRTCGRLRFRQVKTPCRVAGRCSGGSMGIANTTRGAAVQRLATSSRSPSS